MAVLGKVVRLVAMAAVSAGMAAAQHGGSVRSAGQPIPGATVRAAQGARKIVTITNEEGLYTLALGPGAWTVEVEMYGFEPQSRVVENGVQPSAIDWELELKPAPSSVPAGGEEGFRTVALNGATETPEIAEAVAAPAEASGDVTLTEAFLINGSLSQGLEIPQEPDFEEQRRAEWARRAQEALTGRDPDAASEAAPPAVPPSMAGALAGKKNPARTKVKPPPRRNAAQARAAAARKRAAAFGNRQKRGRKRDSLRGSAHLSFRDSALDARPVSLSGYELPKPDYASQRFGFTIGGPLHIPRLLETSRTFFFVNYSGSRGRQPWGASGTLPSALERSGDFSRSVTRVPITVFDRTSGAPFPGNRVPASLMDPAALGLLPFLPLPNQPGLTQNYEFATSLTQVYDNLGVRLNQPLSRKSRVSAAYSRQKRENERAQLFGFFYPNQTTGFSSDLSWTAHFSRNFIHVLKWNFSRSHADTIPYFAFRRDVARELGIGGTSPDPLNWGPPNLSFTNFSGLRDASPVLRQDQTSGLSESLTLVRGAHSFSFGGEYRRNHLDTRTDQNARGSYSFSGLMTSAVDAKGNPLAGTGFDFADFLLGYPQSASLRYGSNITYFRETAASGFFQDDWRVRQNFTINAGFRYEYFSPFREQGGRIANLDVAPGFTGVAVVTPANPKGPYSGVFPAGLIDPDRNNFAPRVGIAWHPSRKRTLNVRAGYAWHYNGSIYSQFATRLNAQPPFANTAHQSTTVTNPLTIRNGFLGVAPQQIRNTYAVDRQYRVGYAQTWNLSVQKDLPFSLVGELGYLATKGTRLDIQRLPNRAAPGSPLTAEQRRQIGNAVGFTYESSEGSSIYHSAQVRLTRRLRRGMSANVLYTWGKSIDNASTFGGGGNVVAQNDKDLRAERGLSSFDQRHALSLTYYLSSPVGDGAAFIRARGLWGALLKDWAFSGTLSARTGTPLTARVLGNRSDSGGTGVVGNGRAEATGETIRGGRFFNLDAFTLPPIGRYGNAARNTVPGPAILSLNLAFGRSFRVGGDSRRLDLRMESNNVTNTVSFTSLHTVVNSLNYGLPAAAAPMRSINGTIRFRF